MSSWFDLLILADDLTFSAMLTGDRYRCIAVGENPEAIPANQTPPLRLGDTTTKTAVALNDPLDFRCLFSTLRFLNAPSIQATNPS